MTEERQIDFYQNRFDYWLPQLKNGTVLWDGKHKERFVMADDEYFKRAWSPLTKARSQLPKTWWVSNKGNVLSMKYKIPRVLTFTSPNSNGRPRQVAFINGHSKSLSLETIRFTVFGGRAWHSSKKAFEERGLDAFHGADRHCLHHKYIYNASLNRQANSDPSDLALVPTWLNKLLHDWDAFNDDWIDARTEPVTDIDIFKKLAKRQEKLVTRTQNRIDVPVEIVLKETDIDGQTVKYLDLWQIV